MGVVELRAGRFYWVWPAYGDPDDWIVARWEYGCWWSTSHSHREITPKAISGPIEPPATLPVDGTTDRLNSPGRPSLNHHQEGEP